MPKTKVQKQELVAVITDKLSRSKSVVFTDYQGLTMSQLSDLRKQLRAQGAEFSITKNSLLSLALKEAKFEGAPDIETGPTATLFSFEDEITPIKTLVKILKDVKIGKIKSGFVSEEYLDSFAITRIANLPSKLELQAKVVGSLSSPLYGIVGVLHANLRNLVYALDQIRISKEVTR